MTVDGAQVSIMHTEVLAGSRHFLFPNVTVASCSPLCDTEGAARPDLHAALCLLPWDLIVMQIDQREHKQNHGRKGAELKSRRQISIYKHEALFCT